MPVYSCTFLSVFIYSEPVSFWVPFHFGHRFKRELLYLWVNFHHMVIRYKCLFDSVLQYYHVVCKLSFELSSSEDPIRHEGLVTFITLSVFDCFLSFLNIIFIFLFNGHLTCSCLFCFSLSLLSSLSWISQSSLSCPCRYYWLLVIKLYVVVVMVFADRWDNRLWERRLEKETITEHPGLGHSDGGW